MIEAALIKSIFSLWYDNTQSKAVFQNYTNEYLMLPPYFDWKFRSRLKINGQVVISTLQRLFFAITDNVSDTHCCSFDWMRLDVFKIEQK